MLKHILAAALATLAAQSFAADYYLVVPVPNRAPAPAAEKIHVALNASALPAAQLNAVYAGFDFKSILQVTGDPAFSASGVQWTVAGGALPAGLTLSGVGQLTGTPTAPGTFSFTAQAAYKDQVGSAAYSILVQGPRNIAQYGGYRAWGDGSFAVSCNGYRNPAAGYLYTGATGDGTYRIQPTGHAPMNVVCDMTNDGGGWTLAAAIRSDDVSHTNAAAVGTLAGATQSAPAKLADSVINSLGGTYLALRADNGIRHYWKFNGVPFAAVGAAVSRPMSDTFTGAFEGSPAPVNGAHGGLNAYPVRTVVYGDAAPGSGCRRGIAATNTDWCGVGSAGTMWVK